MVLMVLEGILVFLGVVLVVLHGAQRQCSEQMFGTDSVRNNVPSQLSIWCYTDLSSYEELPPRGSKESSL